MNLWANIKLADYEAHMSALGVIQKNCGIGFVSSSKTSEKLASLSFYYHDIDENELINQIDLKLILRNRNS